MSLGSQEHADLVAMFERLHKGRRLDKEPKALWAKCRFYQDGELNELFLSFHEGVAFGKAISR